MTTPKTYTADEVRTAVIAACEAQAVRGVSGEMLADTVVDALDRNGADIVAHGWRIERVPGAEIPNCPPRAKKHMGYRLTSTDGKFTGYVMPEHTKDTAEHSARSMAQVWTEGREMLGEEKFAAWFNRNKPTGK